MKRYSTLQRSMPQSAKSAVNGAIVYLEHQDGTKTLDFNLKNGYSVRIAEGAGYNLTIFRGAREEYYAVNETGDAWTIISRFARKPSFLS